MESISFQSSKLSQIQLELLRIYAFNPSEEEMLQVKNLLARFFADRFIDKIGQAATELQITDADLDRWLEEDEQ